MLGPPWESSRYVATASDCSDCGMLAIDKRTEVGENDNYQLFVMYCKQEHSIPFKVVKFIHDEAGGWSDIPSTESVVLQN